MKEHPQVLIVDDDPEISTMMARALSRHGFRIDSTNSPDEAMARAETNQYDAVLLDLVMPGRDGADLATALREKIPGLTVAFLTGYSHSPLIVSAQRAGSKVFTKPVAIQEIVDFLTAAIG